MSDSPLSARDVIARAHGTSPDRVALGGSVADVIRALAGSGVDDALVVTHIDAALDARSPGGRILQVTSPSVPAGRALTGDELRRLIEKTPEGGLLIIDESLSEFATSPRSAFAAPLLGPVMTDPRIAVVRAAPVDVATEEPRAGYAIAAPEVIAALATGEPTADQVAAIARHFSPDGLDDALDRADWIAAERQRVERTLRDRMEKAEIDGKPFIDIVHSDGDAVWLPVGDRAAELAAVAGGTEYPGEGVRYRIGTDNDAFIDAVTEWATTPRTRAARAGA